MPSELISNSFPKPINNSTEYTNLIFSNNGIFSLSTPVLPLPAGGSFDPNHGDQIQVGIINERRIRRMISNRESARRSRLRKKQQIDELQVQVDHLGAVNSQLSEKLISLLESNHEILQENAQLKEKISSLQMIVNDMISPFPEDVSNNYADHRKMETPSRYSRQM